jgi:site-specific DNA recombinase
VIKPRRSSNPEPAARKTVRCAIYTRKSTEEGLDQDFNSLDAQRESAEAYIRSQSHEGWKLVPTRYDDGGFSGGNLERPALRALLDDIKAGKVDCVVVYKVDRLSRSLMDFSKLVEVFEAHGVSFVSVTQQFNTTHSMGRLTLNILLSFAQFEREIIGERIRDKLAAHKRKGKWTGGRPVLGYDVDRTVRSPRLVLNQTEAAHVREIYEIYLRTGSLIECTRQVGQRGFATKKVLMRNGRITGGNDFRNRYNALLKRILRCKHCDSAMTHVFQGRDPRKYRYYTCASAMRLGRKTCPHPTLPATEIEQLVVDELRRYCKRPDVKRAVRASLARGGRPSDGRLAALLADFEAVWATLEPREQVELVRLAIGRVEFDSSDSSIEVVFRGEDLGDDTEQSEEAA